MRELMRSLPPGNRLIHDLNPEDRDALLAIAVPVEFALGHVFNEPDDPIEHLHFIDSGFCSSVAVLEDGRTVETVMIGREGVLGVVASVVPHHAHTRSVAQVAGTARRVDAAKFRALSAQRPGVRDAVAELSPRQQEAVRLMHLQDMSLNEASVQSKQSVGSLKVACHRALKTLKHALHKGDGRHD